MIFAWLKGRTETTWLRVLTDCLSFVLKPSDSTWGHAVAGSVAGPGSRQP